MVFTDAYSFILSPGALSYDGFLNGLIVDPRAL